MTTAQERTPHEIAVAIMERVTGCADRTVKGQYVTARALRDLRLHHEGVLEMLLESKTLVYDGDLFARRKDRQPYYWLGINLRDDPQAILQYIDATPRDRITAYELAEARLYHPLVLDTLVKDGHLMYGPVSDEDCRLVYAISHTGRAGAGAELAALRQAVTEIAGLSDWITMMIGSRSAAAVSGEPVPGYVQFQYERAMTMLTGLALGLADAATLGGYYDASACGGEPGRIIASDIQNAAATRAPAPN